MPSLRARVALVLALLLPLSLSTATTANADPTAEVTTALPDSTGAPTVVAGWQIQSSAQVGAGAEEISRTGFSARAWYPVGPRSTVLSGLMQNHKYSDLFYSTNLRDKVNPADFKVPWWYRTEFNVRGFAPTTLLRVPGVISRGEVWVNGTKVGDVVGTYNAREFDISKVVRPGRNALAIKVAPSNPQEDFAISWIDWAQPAPDANMGIWRDVEIARTGPVSVVGSYVHTKLALPGMQSADVTAFSELRNNTPTPQTVTLQGNVGDHWTAQSVRLNANETRTVSFPVQNFRNPRVWWPAQLGDQPLYRLDVTARVNGWPSDQSSNTFGIRDVQSSLNASGDRQFVINGRPLQIRGAGWAPDLLLRSQPDRLEEQFKYVRDLGLNTIRMEGKLETPEFYNLADRYGIMLLPGWECCDKWEPFSGWGGSDWTTGDYDIARGSMAAQARFLRSHASVIGFFVGSDVTSPTDVQQMYLAEFDKAGWANPVISAASLNGGPLPPLGSSGSKMEGPYDWVPPKYWYGDKVGAAFGFGGELSAGHSIPNLDSVKAMLSPAEQEQLWKEPDTPQFHTGRGEEPFNNLSLFNNALTNRYGKPTSLTDYVDKAQLAGYEQVRAQFEANSRRMTAQRPATGMIYWMLNNAWPSLNWHLYGNDLVPAGAYFGAKKANEPLHVQYSYDDRSVVVVGQGPKAAQGLTVKAEVYTLDGKLVHSQEKRGLSVASLGVTEAFQLPELPSLSTTYFVRLNLTDRNGRGVSENTYWLSTKQDEVDWENSDWYYTPVSAYADLQGLSKLPKAAIDVKARSHNGTTTVTVKNTSSAVAPLVGLTLRKADGSQVTPVTWSENYVSLLPGESVTLTANHGECGRPTVEATGLNVATSKTLAE
jgi:exo-1,4-beta-D-glucosaminidase